MCVVLVGVCVLLADVWAELKSPWPQAVLPSFMEHDNFRGRDAGMEGWREEKVDKESTERWWDRWRKRCCGVCLWDVVWEAAL